MACPRGHSYEVMEQGLFHPKTLIHSGKTLGEKIFGMRKQKKPSSQGQLVVKVVLASVEIVAIHHDSCSAIS